MYIKDGGCPTLPEAMGGDIAPQLQLGVCSSVACLVHVPTNVDQWFIQYGILGEGLGAEVVPLCIEVIMAL